MPPIKPIDQAEIYVQRAWATSQRLNREHGVPSVLLADLETFLAHAERQIDQIRRRVLQDEKIPHAEKVFSLFQPHTEYPKKQGTSGSARAKPAFPWNWAYGWQSSKINTVLSCIIR